MDFEILHHRALRAAKKLHSAEVELVEILQEIDDCRGFKELGYSSLFVYATDELGLSEECAFKLIRVERKSSEVPELKVALEAGKFTLSKAVVIASVITPENQAHWISMASKHSKRELEKLVAEAQPGKPKPERIRPQGDMMRLEFSVTREVFELLQRSQDLVAQKRGDAPSMAEVLGILAAAYVQREDPVEKADRSAHKAHKHKAHKHKAHKTVPGDSSSRQESRHQVHHRDRGRCQYKFPNGKICGQRKWVHLHHIRPKSQGGLDDPENLVTLCAAHHRMVHETAHETAHEKATPFH
jgi:hypothetical protein